MASPGQDGSAWPGQVVDARPGQIPPAWPGHVRHAQPGGAWPEQLAAGVELAVEDQEEGGEDGDADHPDDDHTDQLVERLDERHGGLDELGELAEEDAELLEVVEVLHHGGETEDGAALEGEEEEGDGVQVQHRLGLPGRERDWHQEGDEDVDHLVVGLEGLELGLHDREDEVGDRQGEEHRHKEEPGGVLEADDVDTELGEDKQDPDEHEEAGAEARLGPEVLPVPVVVLEDGVEHGQEGDDHHGADVGLEVDPKGLDILLHEPVEADEKNALYDQLAKRLGDDF